MGHKKRGFGSAEDWLKSRSVEDACRDLCWDVDPAGIFDLVLRYDVAANAFSVESDGILDPYHPPWPVAESDLIVGVAELVHGAVAASVKGWITPIPLGSGDFPGWAPDQVYASLEECADEDFDESDLGRFLDPHGITGLTMSFGDDDEGQICVSSAHYAPERLIDGLWCEAIAWPVSEREVYNDALNLLRRVLRSAMSERRIAGRRPRTGNG